MTSRTSWARLAANRSNSVSGNIGLALWRVLEQVADFLANLRAARLTRDDDVVALGLEAGGKQIDLGGFARAFGTFEGK